MKTSTKENLTRRFFKLSSFVLIWLGVLGVTFLLANVKDNEYMLTRNVLLFPVVLFCYRINFIYF